MASTAKVGTFTYDKESRKNESKHDQCEYGPVYWHSFQDSFILEYVPMEDIIFTEEIVTEDIVTEDIVIEDGGRH